MKVRVEWELSGEAVLDLPDDFHHGEMWSVTTEVLGLAQDDVEDRFDEAFRGDAEVVSFDCNQSFKIVKDA